MSDRSPSSPQVRPRRFPDDNATVRRFGDTRSSGGALFVSARVLGALELLLDRCDGEGAWLCLLLGRLHEEPEGPFVEIRSYAELQRRPAGPEFVRTLVGEWELVRTRLRRAFPSQRVLGWAAVRPGDPEELLPSELLLHNSLFHLPHQVSLILSSTEGSIAAHGRDPGGRLNPIGFNVVWRAPFPGAERDPAPSERGHPS